MLNENFITVEFWNRTWVWVNFHYGPGKARELQMVERVPCLNPAFWVV